MTSVSKFVVSVCIFLLIASWVRPVMAADRFFGHGDGTVSDNRTGLMWAAADNGIPINWMDAHSYCTSCRHGGYSDWRMPTVAELASLYDPEEKNTRGYHLTALINTTASSCWAVETRGDRAARFNFTYGSVYWLRRPYAGPTRVLPVRNEK